MAFGDPGNPTRFGQGQHVSDPRSLFLDVFGGEVLTAFDLATITLDKVETRNLKGARSARFPKTWKAIAEYHLAGQEMLGNEIETGEITVTVDEILVSHTSIYDLDELLSHFEVRSKFSAEMGRALARVYDKNNFRQLLLSARTAGIGPFPGGTVVTNAALAPTGGVYDGEEWINAIREANMLLFDKDVPDEQTRYMGVNQRIFDAIKFAKNADGNYILQSRDFMSDKAGGFTGRSDVINVDGVSVYKTRNMPTTNETADTSVYSKYRANYSTTVGVLWTPAAAAVAKVMDIGVEQDRDTRRLEDFMVAKMLVGHGTLRPECAVEFRTGVPV